MTNTSRQVYHRELDKYPPFQPEKQAKLLRKLRAKVLRLLNVLHSKPRISAVPLRDQKKIFPEEFIQEQAELDPRVERLYSKVLEATTPLLEHNLRLVTSIASRVYPDVPHHEYMDLVQAGNLGLRYGILCFDPQKGLQRLPGSFSTYAGGWIHYFMQKAMDELVDGGRREPLNEYLVDGKPNSEEILIQEQQEVDFEGYFEGHELYLEHVRDGVSQRALSDKYGIPRKEVKLELERSQEILSKNEDLRACLKPKPED